MDDFRKCNFCQYYDEYEGCEWGCDNYEDFKPAKWRMVEFAKEHKISVADLIALIEME